MAKGMTTVFFCKECGYEASKWMILIGSLTCPEEKSTYSFFKNQIGFDFVDFMHRNQMEFQKETHKVLEELLDIKKD